MLCFNMRFDSLNFGERLLRYLLAALFVLLVGCAPPANEVVRLSGAYQQGGLIVGTALPQAQVRLNGERVKVYDDGRFLLGFDRDAAPSHSLHIRWPTGRSETLTLPISAQEYRVQNITNVDQSRVTPPQEVLDRIAKESQETSLARSIQTDKPFFDAGWIWPVSGPVTGVYGSARIYNGTPGAPHWGIDIAAPTGTPILAPSAGLVRLVHQDNYFAGGLVILDHGYGLTSSFLHMSRIDVRPGDLVQRGAVLGAVGSTGRSTGPHLDWRMNLGPDTRLDVALLPLPPGP